MLALAAVACSQPPEVGRATSRALGGAGRVVPWSQVTLRPAGPELLAEGPSAVAVAPDGSVLVLDRLGGKVLRLTDGQLTVAASVPGDVEDLAVGPDGAVAVYSPLRARVWIHGPAGEPAGELAVPRVLRMVRGIALGPSRQLWLQDAHQQRFRLGSPTVPQALPAVLHSRREGEPLPDGSGVLVQVTAGGAWLERVERRVDRTRVVARWRLPGPVLAARVVGATREVACLRLEQRALRAGPANTTSEPLVSDRDTPAHGAPAAGRRAPAAGDSLVIGRRALCLDLRTGRTLLEQPLPLGLYLPRRELGLGGDPAQLALIRPEPSGLRVTVWPLRRGRAER